MLQILRELSGRDGMLGGKRLFLSDRNRKWSLAVGSCLRLRVGGGRARCRRKVLRVVGNFNHAVDLRGLQESLWTRASPYIGRTARQIDADYRRKIEAALGWTFSSYVLVEVRGYLAV